MLTITVGIRPRRVSDPRKRLPRPLHPLDNTRTSRHFCLYTFPSFITSANAISNEPLYQTLSFLLFFLMLRYQRKPRWRGK